MQATSSNIHKLRVKPDSPTQGTFELKTAHGKSLGFVMNGNAGGVTLVVAGIGPVARTIFEKITLCPKTNMLQGRLALIFLDCIESAAAQNVLKDISSLLKPVNDILFLPTTGPEHDETVRIAAQTIENFCTKNGLLPVNVSKPDCASI